MIEIRVVSRGGVALDGPLQGRFGPTGGTIGRGSDCTLVLPDPERRMSRRQLEVHWRSGGPVLRPVGAPLLITLNGRALEPQVDVPLNPGDELRLAGFVLAVVQVGVAPAGVPVQPASLPSPALRAAPPSPPVLDVAIAADDAGWRPEPLPDGGPPAPFVKPFPDDPALPATFAYDREVDARAPVAVPLHEVDLLIGETSLLLPEPAPVAPSPAPAALPLTPMAPVPPVPPVPAAAVDGADWAALFEGLGLPVPRAGGDRRAQLRLIGALLRTTLSGTLRLLNARTIAKRELGAGATMLQTRENNPLKFSPDVDVALDHLLGPVFGRPQPGFMPALAAIAEAVDDLQAHQMAVLAGTRAALDAVLGRFDPAVLETRLAPRGVLDQWVPAKRRAELWSAYVGQYADILREATDDFDRLFGRAFLEAYEAQLEQLGQAGEEDGDALR